MNPADGKTLTIKEKQKMDDEKLENYTLLHIQSLKDGEASYENALSDILHGRKQKNYDELSTEHYVQHNDKIEEQRKVVKKRWTNAKTKYTEKGNELLDAYRKLLRIQQHTTGDESNSLQDLTDQERTKLESETSDRTKARLADVATALTNYEAASRDLEAQDRSFRLFQRDKGKVISAVEKHKVRSMKMARSLGRSEAHRAILTALSCSPVVASMEAQEKEDTIQEVQGLLQELETVEMETDELVERLELKVSAINIAELKQSDGIEESLERQEQLNKGLDSLNLTIQENNDTIKQTRESFQKEILENIDDILGAGRRSLQALCFLVALMVIVCILVFLYQQKWWPFAS